MNHYDLLEAIGGVDVRLVERAVSESPRARRWPLWAASAAALCILFAAGWLLLMSQDATDSSGHRQYANGLRSDERASAPSPSAHASAETEDEPDGESLFIPRLEPSPLDAAGEGSMIPLVVYRGGVYTAAECYLGDEAGPVEGLLGVYLGRVKASIDEGAGRAAYGEDFAGTVSGELYAVRGYDTDFRICLRETAEAEEGGQVTLLQFLERLNDVRLNTGKDLFIERLYLRERVRDIQFLTHVDWDYDSEAYQSAEIAPDLWRAFLDELERARFVDSQKPGESFFDDKPGTKIYDTPNQTHLRLLLDDGSRVWLRLIEGGYVGYEPLGRYFVRMPGSAFDAVYEACGGTQVDDWAFSGR